MHLVQLAPSLCDMSFDYRRATSMVKKAPMDVWKLLKAGTADLFNKESMGSATQGYALSHS